MFATPHMSCPRNGVKRHLPPIGTAKWRVPPFFELRGQSDVWSHISWPLQCHLANLGCLLKPNRGFPGIPPVIIHLNGMVLKKHQPLLGPPMTMETPMTLGWWSLALTQAEGSVTHGSQRCHLWRMVVCVFTIPVILRRSQGTFQGQVQRCSFEKERHAHATPSEEWRKTSQARLDCTLLGNSSAWAFFCEVLDHQECTLP